jgi:hypothetical protein
MSGSGGRDWRAAGCAALAAAAIAFPAGLYVGGNRAPAGHAREPSRPAPSPSGPARTSRNVYSPRVSDDPYVIEEQRKVLQALELSCRQMNRHCAEAEQARRRIEEAQAGP